MESLHYASKPHEHVVHVVHVCEALGKLCIADLELMNYTLRTDTRQCYTLPSGGLRRDYSKGG